MPETVAIGNIKFTIWDVIKVISIITSIVLGYANVDKRLTVIQSEVTSLRTEAVDFKENYVVINNRINDLDTRVTVLEQQ